MEAIRSSETTGATQRTTLFITTGVKTSNPTQDATVFQALLTEQFPYIDKFPLFGRCDHENQDQDS
jgi:hypothetical protein